MEEGRQQNAGYLNASAAAERLQRNVNREHFLCTDFLLAFWQVRLLPAKEQPHIPCTRACVCASVGFGVLPINVRVSRAVGCCHS